MVKKELCALIPRTRRWAEGPGCGRPEAMGLAGAGKATRKPRVSAKQPSACRLPRRRRGLNGISARFNRLGSRLVDSAASKAYQYPKRGHWEEAKFLQHPNDSSVIGHEFSVVCAICVEAIIRVLRDVIENGPLPPTSDLHGSVARDAWGWGGEAGFADFDRKHTAVSAGVTPCHSNCKCFPVFPRDASPSPPYEVSTDEYPRASQLEATGGIRMLLPCQEWPDRA